MVERILDLPGAVNFRDFGGYETVTGERVQHGKLFRCGELSGLTEEGCEAFLDLGIGIICDLRRPDERDEAPTPFSADLQELVPIDPGSAVQMRDKTANPNLDHDQRIAFMTGINVELARDHAADYRRVFEVLLAEERGFLIHCTAGKDRTGFGVAIIQLALGVPRELVIEDYLLTNEAIDFEAFLLPKVRARYGHDRISVEDVRTVSGVRKEYIHAALDTVDDEYGCVDDYLTRALAVGPQQREALRELYLER